MWPRSRTELETATVTASIDAIAEEWDHLADHRGASPFLRPGWIDAWWRAFGTGELEVRTVRHDGRLTGVLPLVRRRSELRSPTNFHTPEFGPLAEDSVAAAALAEGAFSGRERRVALSFLDSGRPGVAQCRASAQDTGRWIAIRHQQSSPYVAVEGGWTAYQDQLGRGRRADLRRCQRRLEEEGKVEHTIDTDVGRLDEFLRVELAGWKGDRGTAVAARPQTERFYRDIASWAAGRGTLRLEAFRVDGRAIAVLYCIEDGNVKYALKSGYDPAYRRTSPGRLLLHRTVAAAFATGLTSVEMLGDSSPYKLEWATGVRERVAVEAFTRSLTGTLHWGTTRYGRPLIRPLARRLRGGHGSPRATG